MEKHCEIPCELCPHFKLDCPLYIETANREQIRMNHHDGLYKMPEE